MRLNIYFSNRKKDETVRYPTCRLVRAAIRTALLCEKQTGGYEVSVTFCGDGFIRDLNARYRGIDRATDVLSFPLQDGEEGGFEGGSGCVPLGDIVISIDRARRQAIEYGHSVERELAFLAAHATLHLLGYDHERSEADELDMRARQRKIMRRMGLTRGESEKRHLPRKRNGEV